MMVDRRTVTVPKSWAWSVLVGGCLLVGVLVMVGLTMINNSERDRLRDRAQVALAADVRRIATASKAAAEDNNRLLRDSLPCVEGDAKTPPSHPSCVRAEAAEKVVDKALADIAVEDLRQHQHLVDVVADLVGKRAPRLPPPPDRPPRSTPTTVAPRTGATPPSSVAPPTTAGPALVRPVPVPATTTTTCPTRGKSEKCR